MLKGVQGLIRIHKEIQYQQVLRQVTHRHLLEPAGFKDML